MILLVLPKMKKINTMFTDSMKKVSNYLSILVKEGTRLISHIDEALTEINQEENIQISKKFKLLENIRAKLYL